MNTRLKCFSFREVICPVRPYRKTSVICNLAIVLPCFLICDTTFAGDERAELLDGRSMGKQVVFDEILNRGAVVIPVVPGEVNLTKNRIEGGDELGAGGNADSIFLAPQLKPMIGEHDEKCTSKSYECSEYRSFYDWFLTAYSIGMMFLTMWLTCPEDKKPNDANNP